MSHAFELKQAAVSYNGTAAVHGIDLTIATDEAVAVVGPSGAGKTTLLRLLNGTVRSTGGHIAVLGRSLREMPPRELRGVRARIGFIHQDLSLVPNLRVIQNVLSGRVGDQGFFGSLRHVFFPPRDAVHEVHRILERVGIPEKLYERTDTLSGGQRQRVAIARALYQEPEALLADEPVSSVDPARARDTVALLTDVCRERGLALCMSLHNLDLAREFFPRLIGMRSGQIRFDQPTAKLTDGDFEALYNLERDEMLKA